MAKNNDIGRNWTFELYPESMDPNYRSILDALHCQWVESPVHDQDLTMEGDHKKDHIHIVLAFEGNKSYSQVKDIALSCKGVIPPVDTARISSIRGMVRYLIHLDNPEKHQYERSGIIAHGGMDIAPYFQYAGEMIKKMLSDMQAYICAQSIYEYSDFLDYAAAEHYNDWYDLLTIGHQSFVIKNYIDSRRNKGRVKAYYEETKRKRKRKEED